MPTLEEELSTNKKFKGNVVIRFLGEYFTIRDPDDAPAGFRPEYRGLISSLVLNPTTIDPRRVSTTISSQSFKLTDKLAAISALVKDTAAELINQEVEIWLGRSGVSMDFADYYKLPVTRINKLSKTDGGYTFSCTEESDRMNRPIYDATARLSGAIVAGTTVFSVRDDISNFPASGYLRLENEFLGYTAKDDGTKTFSGLTRGEFSTTPAAHDDGDDIYLAERIVDNPINILLKLLCSGGGGGAYDTLADGLGIGPALIDLDEIEDLRDTIFADAEFDLCFYNVTNALRTIEKEILAPCNLRFTYSRASKLTLALLDKAKFVNSVDVIDEDTITQHPEWAVDDTKIVNAITIEWDFDEDTNRYTQKNTYEDADSIAAFGKTASPPTFQFKGVKEALDGQEFVDDFAQAFIDRLKNPYPEITVKTHIDKGLLNVGDKSFLESSMIPNERGQLNFASELEIINRSINWITGEVSLRLAFTSFTGVRSCYLAPADTFGSVSSDSVGELGAGRGEFWEAGWKCRLWDNVANDYATSQVNEIESIDGDELTFVDDWDVSLSTDHRLKFPDYDDAVAEQKRYCFISPTGLDFPNTDKSYKIVP